MVSPFTMARKGITRKAAAAAVFEKDRETDRDRGRRRARGRGVHPPVCHSCGLLGHSHLDLIFCARCLRSFHRSCIGIGSGITRAQAEAEAETLVSFATVTTTSSSGRTHEPWTCYECQHNEVRCFDCKEYCHLSDGILKCCQKDCRNYFHEECAKKWKLVTGLCSNRRRVYTCPQHSCHKCHRSINWGQLRLVSCLSCPVAYHKKCLPKNANTLEGFPSFFLCEKHRLGQAPGNSSAPGSVFMQLPIPDVPIDFQIPQFFKKQKLVDYTRIRRNFYIAKKHQDDVGSMLCKCSEGSCDSQCLCMHAHYSCTTSCNCGGICDNRAFHLRKAKKLKMAMTEKSGWGIKAGEDIKEGDFLIEYVGEVIDDKQCEARLWKMKNEHKTNFYLCEINREMVIDATYKGNMSRFINHSCQPNTELQKWQNDGETRIGVFAICDIRKGEFVTYDYQFINFGTTQECYCGATTCRGFLGVKPSRQKLSSDAAMKLVTNEVIFSGSEQRTQQYNSLNTNNSSLRYLSKARTLLPSIHLGDDSSIRCIGLRVRIWWPEDNKFYCGVINSYDPNTNQHTINYDDGDVEYLVVSNERWEVDFSFYAQQVKQNSNASVNLSNKINRAVDGA